MSQQSFLEGPGPGEYEIPNGAEVKHCKSCGAAIVWIATPKGYAMPINAMPIRMNGLTGYGQSHFATCPNAREWRRKAR
jgi:hypothetical protein